MSAKAIPLKQWLYEEAIRQGLHPWAVWMRYHKGQYPTLRTQHVNARVVLVLNPEQTHTATTRAHRPYQTRPMLHRIPANIAAMT